MARGYVYAHGYTAESKPIAESRASSAGGIVSTAADLQKWGEALSSGRIISTSDYQLLTSPARLEDGSAAEYGFGMRIDRFDGQPRVWHDGNTNGFDGTDEFFPSQGVRIIVLTNALDGGSDHIARQIYDDLFPAIAAAARRAEEAAQHSATALLYSRSLRVMDGLRQPKFLAYRLESTSDGLQIYFWADHAVMGPAVYDIEDRGARSCPSGKPGHALHFTSRENNYLHQLSDVVIEVGSERFCVVRFLARGAGAVVTSGTFEEHYADVNGYWLQTDAVLDGMWQASALSPKRHGVWRYRLVDISFPDTLPNDIFAAHTSP